MIENLFFFCLGIGEVKLSIVYAQYKFYIYYLLLL